MTSQELYEIVRREIDIRASLDPAFRFSQQQLDKGNGDFTNSDQCSQILSTILGKELAKHILEIGVGEGRSEVCQQLLKDHFDKVSRNFERAQSIQDRGKGIDLGSVTPEFPAERAKQVGDSLDDTTVSDETIQRRCQGAVTNVAKSMHDSFVKENARVRNDLGLKPIIQRFGTAPCAWCADVAGKYRYGEQPDDIFRRHDNCNCTIIYDTQVLRGAKTESGGRSKTWTEIDPKEIEDNAFNPTTFTQEQARQLEQSQLNQITRLTPEQAQNLSLTTGGKPDTINRDGNFDFYSVSPDALSSKIEVKAFDDEKLNATMSDAMHNILKAVQPFKPGTEIGVTISTSDYSVSEQIRGGIGEGTITIPERNTPYVSIHNHASGQTLSDDDLSSLIKHVNEVGAFVIGNNGNVYGFIKNSDYDWIKTQIGMALKDTDQIIEEILENGGAKYGLSYYQRFFK